MDPIDCSWRIDGSRGDTPRDSSQSLSNQIPGPVCLPVRTRPGSRRRTKQQPRCLDKETKISDRQGNQEVLAVTGDCAPHARHAPARGQASPWSR
jgi:hypothetical protein